MEKKYKDFSGAILAGGRNKRMKGVDKSFIKVGGVSIIQRAVDTLKSIFAEVIIVTNSPLNYKLYDRDCSIISDIIKDTGPLGGIHSALSHTTKDAVFFVACDMPFLHNDLIRDQLEYFNKAHCDALVPRIKGEVEPLHGIYKKNLKDALRVFIEKTDNRSVRSFLKTINAEYWDLADTPFYRNVFKNLNAPEDVEKAT